MTDSEKLDLILEKVNNFEQDLQEIKARVVKTDLTVENEIRVNIQRVAEGYLDLSRKLNECIRLSNDIKDKQEIQDIYINMHNNKSIVKPKPHFYVGLSYVCLW